VIFAEDEEEWLDFLELTLADWLEQVEGAAEKVTIQNDSIQNTVWKHFIWILIILMLIFLIFLIFLLLVCVLCT
jgi:hypothetical protein